MRYETEIRAMKSQTAQKRAMAAELALLRRKTEKERQLAHERLRRKQRSDTGLVLILCIVFSVIMMVTILGVAK